MMDVLLQDLRYALRGLRRTPGFTLVAVLTLALGIGANASVFTLLSAALLRRISSDAPGRLVWLVGTAESGSRFSSMSYPEFRDHQVRDDVFAGLAAYDRIGLVLGSGGEPERIGGLVVTGGYFSVLGIRAAAGRFLQPADEAPGAEPAVVLSDGLWRRRFGADSGLIGRAILISSHPFTVVGVAPPGFVGVDIGEAADVFVPMTAAAQAWPGIRARMDERSGWWLRAIGRLRSGVSLTQARAQVRSVGAQLSELYPGTQRRTGAWVEPLAGGLDPNNRRQALPVLVMLMAVPAIVLLIACANLANLLLNRAAARRREIGVRLALGATRGRLVRQLLTESLVLGLLAGVAALLLSLWLSDGVALIGQVPLAITSVMKPDRYVLAFTAILAVVTGVVFGLVPALGATRPALVETLSEGGVGGTPFRRSRLVSLFVIAQVAASLVLLVTAGLFLRSLDKATRVDPGFDPRHGLVATIDLEMQGYNAERRDVFYREVVSRAAALPGVRAVTLTGNLPLTGRDFGAAVYLEGRQRDADGIGVGFTTIWSGYFATLGVPLVAGREVTAADGPSSPPVAIVNETLARRLWPGQPAIGKRLRFGGPDRPLLEVVGVARDGKYSDLTEDSRNFVYLPERQQAGVSPDMTLLVRTVGDPAAMAPALRGLIRSMDPSLAVFDTRTLEDVIQGQLGKSRAASALLGSFGALALLLASLGLYGVVAYGVTRRTREIGIRMALGAARRNVLGLIVGEGVRLAAAGIVIGLVASALLTRLVSRFLYGVTATDLGTFAAVSLVLAGVAVAASLVPARRAARVDPMAALRSE